MAKADGGMPPERDVKEFRYKQLCKVKVSDKWEGLPRCQLLTGSSKYGLIIVATSNGLKLLKASDICEKDLAHPKDKNNVIIEDCPVQSSVPLPQTPCHIAVNCDEGLLLVVTQDTPYLSATFYPLPSLAIQNPPPSAVGNCMLGSGLELTDTAWNPTLPHLLAVCLSDGSVCLINVTGQVSITAKLPPTTQATCICWSPKGKQLVVGKRDGTLSQYDQNLTEKKRWPKPTCFSNQPTKVIDVLWESTHMFVGVYFGEAPAEGDQPMLVITNAPKDGVPTFINFEDLCLGTGENITPKYFKAVVSKWEMLLFSSSTSASTSILAKNPNEKTSVVWERWNLDDSWRAELPLDQEYADTFPLGMTIDYSSQSKLTLDDKTEYPPCPLLVLLSTDGLLVPFYMINTHPGAPSLVSPPQTIPGAITPAASSNERPVAKNLFGSSSTQGLPTPSFSFSTPQKSSGFSFSLAASSTPTIGGAHPSTAPQQTLPATSTQPALNPPALSQPFGNAQAAPSFASTAALQGQSSAFSFGQSNPSAATSFGFGQSGPSMAFVSKSQASSVPSTVSMPPKTTSAMIGQAKTASSESLVTSTPIGQSRPVTMATPTSLGGMAQPIPFSQSGQAAASRLNQTVVKPSSTQNTLPTSVQQQQTAETVAKQPVTQADGQTDEEHNESINQAVDTEFNQSIMEEISHFNREMRELKERSQTRSVKIGTPEERTFINQSTRDLCIFLQDIKETTQTQHKEIHDVKSSSLDMFSMVEECRSQEQRNKENKYQYLLQSRPLDPGSADKMKSLKQQYQFAENGVRDINLVLDLQWEDYQSKKKQKNRRIQTPTTDSLYRVVRNNHNLILGEKKKIAKVQESLKKLRLYNNTAQWDAGDTQNGTPSTPKEKEINLSSLAESLLESTSSPQTPSKEKKPQSLSPEKEAKLRDFMLRHSVSSVKSMRPGNLSMSKIVAASGLKKRLQDLDSTASSNSEFPSLKSVSMATGPSQRNPNQKVTPFPNSSIGGKDTSTSAGANNIGLAGSSPFSAQTSSRFSAPQPTGISLPLTSGLNVTKPVGFSVPQPSGVSVPQSLGFSVPQPSGLSVPQPTGFSAPQPSGLSVPQPTGFSAPQPSGLSVSQSPGFSFKARSDPSDQSSSSPSVQQSSGPFVQPPARQGHPYQLLGSESEEYGLEYGGGGDADGLPPADLSDQDYEEDEVTGDEETEQETAESWSETEIQGRSNPPGFLTQSVPSLSSTQPGAFFLSGSKTLRTNKSSPVVSTSSAFGSSLGQNSAEQIPSTDKVAGASARSDNPTTSTDPTKTVSGNPIRTESSSTNNVDLSSQPMGFNFDRPSTGFSFGNTSFGVPATVTPSTNTANSSQTSNKSLFGSNNNTSEGLFSSTSAAGGNVLGPTATSSPSGGLFGSDTTKTASGVGSTVTPATTANGTGLMGLTATTTASVGGLFGSAVTPASTTSGGGLFGSITSTTASSGGLFGSSTTTASSGGLFGSSTTTTASSGGLFGSSSTTTASSGGLFGSSSTTTASSGGLFGSNTTTTASSGGLFGSNTTTTASSGGLFGSSSVTPSSGSGLFGSTTTTTASSGGLFGSSSVTPSSGSELFGSTTTTTASGSGLFGSSTTQASTGGLFGPSTAATTAPSGGLFGSATTTTSGGGLFGSATTTTSGGGLFGSATTTTSGGGLFGSATTTTSGGGLFGSATTTTSGGGIFGSATTTTSGGGLFGSAITTTSDGGLFGSATTTTSGGGLFGSATTTTSGGGLFGSATTTTSGGGLFGSATTTTSGGGLFGSATTTTSGGGLFGSATTTPSGGGLFGSATTTTSGGGLFGSATTPSSGGGVFGSATTTTSGVGLFGSSSATTNSNGGPFGSSTASSGSLFNAGSSAPGGSIFGGSTTGPGFGSPAPQGGFLGGLGGKPNAENASKNVFGSSFGASPAPAGNLFGSGGSKSFASGFSSPTSQPASGFATANTNVASGGFGVAQQTQQSGFGSGSPAFGGSPSFGGTPAFGSAPAFGSSPVFGAPKPVFGGGSALGGAPASGGSSGIFGGSQTSAGFAGMANSNSPTFGSLAQQGSPSGFGEMSQQGTGQSGFGSPGFGGIASTQQAGFASPSFGSSPSFTGYRS